VKIKEYYLNKINGEQEVHLTDGPLFYVVYVQPHTLSCITLGGTGENTEGERNALDFVRNFFDVISEDKQTTTLAIESNESNSATNEREDICNDRRIGECTSAAPDFFNPSGANYFNYPSPVTGRLEDHRLPLK
jgi:hypothetical protein